MWLWILELGEIRAVFRYSSSVTNIPLTHSQSSTTTTTSTPTTTTARNYNYNYNNNYNYNGDDYNVESSVHNEIHAIEQRSLVPSHDEEGVWPQKGQDQDQDEDEDEDESVGGCINCVSIIIYRCMCVCVCVCFTKNGCIFLFTLHSSSTFLVPTRIHSMLIVFFSF